MALPSTVALECESEAGEGPAGIVRILETWYFIWLAYCLTLVDYCHKHFSKESTSIPMKLAAHCCPPRLLGEAGIQWMNNCFHQFRY